MNRRQALTSFLIILIMALAVISTNTAKGNNAYQSNFVTVLDSRYLLRPGFSPLRVTNVSLQEGSNLLNQSTRLEIYDFIKDNPGAHFRLICNSLGLPIGVAQYHLTRLTEASLISSRRDKRFKRYYERGRFNETEMKVISLLRQETVRKILTTLDQKSSTSHMDLASKIKISSQDLTWHMKRLTEERLVRKIIDDGRSNYHLVEEYAPIIRVLITL